MGFSNDERLMKTERFTANGFLPEFHKRRRAHDQVSDLLPPPPIEDHIAVWEI